MSLLQRFTAQQSVYVLMSLCLCVFSLFKWTAIFSVPHISVSSSICSAFWVNAGFVLDTILWSFMVSLAVSVADFFYIFLFFVQCSTTEGLDEVVAFFLNILWEWREVTLFKMSLNLHCTGMKFLKTGFTVSHSALTFNVKLNISVFLCFYGLLRLLSYGTMVCASNYLYYKNVYDKKTASSLLQDFHHHVQMCIGCRLVQHFFYLLIQAR